ncbi:MAG: penicillin acylase family protein [Sphingobacteriales bacterium]|nr:MAG: penicillin acylase family protein [Sphingobacteriales bacterium]
MRILPFVVSTLLTGALVFGLNKKWGGVPPMGAFLSPQQGFWQNAEPANFDFNADLKLPGIKGKTTVYIDNRLVPHVFAEQEEDAYFAQGYLHAKFRLWQMEFQTMAAAGRLAEVVGNNPAIIKYDRSQRRLGMAFGAEKTVQAMEADPKGKKYFDAYTAGVNAYIDNLPAAQLPVEYKLLGYRPEHWSNLKTALFTKAMANDLAGYERDLQFTNERSVFNVAQMKLLYGDLSDSSMPIVPRGTAFAAAGIVPTKPAGADSAYFGNDTSLHVTPVGQPVRENGSNNWAIAGDKSASGAPILCNDPHLNLTLPSIWFEMQLHTPTMNVYGCTFPGAPSVIMGFNDSIAFGTTNAMRDVRDYYSIRFRDASKKEYWYKGQWTPTQLRIESIKVAGAATVQDTVAYTAFGPVMYDASFTSELTGDRAIACRWTGQEGSNEGALFFDLNRAANYDEYRNAIRMLKTPGQNVIFASKRGDIAIWQQGKFPARWEGQGLYVMPGEDDTYAWQGFIPEDENPHVHQNTGFVQSANQRPVDGSYPYFIPGNYITPRGITIAKMLGAIHGATPQNLMALQQSTFNSLAQDAVPLLLRNVDRSQLGAQEQGYYDELSRWDYNERAGDRAATIYNVFLDSLGTTLLGDELEKVQGPKVWPDDQAVIEALLRDSTAFFVDDIRTTPVETLAHEVHDAFIHAASALKAEESSTGLTWWKHKKAAIRHLLRDNLAPFWHKSMEVGGSAATPNAITQYHGPSWRQVIQLSQQTLAYGIYPGGQSGNPGSRFYDNFTDDWARGNYYELWMMAASDAGDRRVKWKMTFNPL